MQGAKNKDIHPTIADVLAGFRAVIHFEETHIPLDGPDVLYTYKDPERDVEQGILVVFKSGDVPMIAMLLEQQGEKVACRASRLANDRLEIFRGERIFSDLENNYVEQPLWPPEEMAP